MVGFRAILEIGVQHTFPQKWPLSGSVDDRPQMAGLRPSPVMRQADGPRPSRPDPEETFAVCRCNACFQEKRTLLSLRVTGESGH